MIKNAPTGSLFSNDQLCSLLVPQCFYSYYFLLMYHVKEYGFHTKEGLTAHLK